MPKTKQKKPTDYTDKRQRPTFRRELTQQENADFEAVVDKFQAFDLAAMIPMLAFIRAAGTWADGFGTFSEYLRVGCDLDITTARGLDLLCDMHDKQVIPTEDVHAHAARIAEAFRRLHDLNLNPEHAEAVQQGKAAADALADEAKPHHRRHARPLSEFR